MSKKTTGLKRNTIDKFYTNSNVVKECLKLVKNNINISDNDLCIEPSAGNGSFIPEIKENFNNYKFYDIEPEHNDIQKQDYLELDFNNILDNYDNIHIIGNPPFGRQSSMAIKFIKKSCQFCNSISFILPKSFKKESLKKHFPLSFHLVYEYELPENSFTVNDTIYGVPCVFQIWVKKPDNRSIPVKLEPKNFKFVKKDDEPDISFRRVGIYAGNIDTQIENKSEQSHYFIKFDYDLDDDLLQKLSEIKFENKNNTVGPKSISKQELIKEFIVFT